MAKKKDMEETNKDEEQEAIDQEVPASDVLVSPSSDQALLPQEIAPQCQAEFGDHVRYVKEDAILHAVVQVVFADGTVDLHVEDPTNAQGRFHVSHANYDAGKSVGTFHYAE